MRNLIAKDLKIKFIETLNELDGFIYEDGNPFLIKIGEKQYFVFLKNLSPAYLKNSDVTRVQLPYSDHFSKIFKEEIPFIILGYDVDNDTVVCWNPQKAKERLNAKRNVSLYSRSSLQQNVTDDVFKFGYLSNGEKIIVFKRKNLMFFFNVALSLFKENSEINSIPVSTMTSQKEYLSDKQRFVLWLQEKYSESSTKVYTYGVEKISKDLKEISVLKENSLFEIKNITKLHELYKKWYSVKEFKDKDLIAKYQISNSFKRYIDFHEYEQSINQANKKSKSQTEKDLKNTEILTEITDKALLDIIKPLLKKNQVLQAVEVTSNYFGNEYIRMTFKEWYILVNQIYKNLSL